MQTLFRHIVMIVLVAAFLLPPMAAGGPGAAAVEPTSRGEAIVGFEPGAMPAVAPGGRFGGHLVLRVATEADFLVVRADDLVPLRRAVGDDARVRYVEDNVVLRALAEPNDPRWASQYGPRLMGFPLAWDGTFGTSSVTVAVIDSGIRRDHEDFDPSLILQGWDYVSNDNDPNDDCGHGTHVAGTVGAWTNNGKGVAGMAQVRIIPMRALSSVVLDCVGNTDDVARAIRDAADQGAHVITMSLGGGSSATLRNAVDYAYGKGVILIGAAGNDGGCCVGFPAAYENVIAVASVTPSKARSSFSSTGPEVEIAAPGSDILSTYSNGGYASLSGTSMAAPHVAGAAALALSWDPALTNTAFRQLLAATAEDLGSPGRDQNFGHGLARIDQLFAALGTPLDGPDNHAPLARFTWTTDGRTVDLDASGSADADGTPLHYSWSFGDNATATGVRVSHTYAANGTYAVTLTADDGAGGQSRLTWDVTVQGAAHPDPDPDAPVLERGTTRPVSLAAGDERLFKIFVPGGNLLTFETTGPGCLPLGLLCTLDIELAARHQAAPTDTIADCRADPRGSSARCIVGTPDPGWWMVRVKASQGNGTLQLGVTWTGGDAAPGNAPPVAGWGYLADNHTVDLDAEGTRDADEDTLSFAWDLGDGNTATGATVQHTFAATGDHDVTLTVDDGQGGRSVLTGTVHVPGPPPPNQAPVAAFVVDAEELRLHLDATGSSDPEGAALTYEWDFGDGTTATGAQVAHDYATAGPYTVVLTVTDPEGLDGTLSGVVTVGQSPDPAPEAEALTFGDARTIQVAAGDTHHYKVYLAAGHDFLMLTTDGQNCSLLGCPHDVDLAVRHNALPTPTDADCRRDTADADTTCVLSAPRGGWWILEVRGSAGSGQVTVRVSGQ